MPPSGVQRCRGVRAAPGETALQPGGRGDAEFGLGGDDGANVGDTGYRPPPTQNPAWAASTSSMTWGWVSAAGARPGTTGSGAMPAAAAPQANMIRATTGPPSLACGQSAKRSRSPESRMLGG